MSLLPGDRAVAPGSLLAGWQGWWLNTSAAARLRVQLATFGVLSIVAYHYSLSTLVSNLSLSTPLAYIGLVPVIALGVAAAKGRAQGSSPDINDRQLDWIVGLPLLAGAAVIELLLPNRVSAMFWVWRLDLLSFPLFVAGSVALIFGTRLLWRQRFAVGYLLLAWPLPYTLVLLQVLNGFTNITLAAMKHLVAAIPVASPVAGDGGSIFQVIHHGTTFSVSVVSACSGVDSVVGFLLVGSAFAALVTGDRLVKGLWLAGGMLLLWGINLGRILFIFWAGQQWGEHVAISILHPFVGLVTFSLGVVAMMLVMPRLGLRLIGSPTGAGALPPPVPAPPAGRRKPAVGSILPAVGVVAIAALVLGVNNTSLKAYDLVANAAGEPRLASFSSDPASPAGWSTQYLTSYNWATPYFGESSTWLRYVYYRNAGAGSLNSSVPITADVINTTELNSFSAYGVEACYNFHGYSMRNVASVDLAGGIKGQTLSYATGRSSTWTIVFWIMPVKASKGGSTHYERVILYIQDSPATEVHTVGVVSGIKNIEGTLNADNSEDARLLDERGFLVQFARQVIVNQSHIEPGSRLASNPYSLSDAVRTVHAPAGSGSVQQ